MELIDVLDDNGCKTGKVKERALVHKNGDWHRAVFVWIMNDKKEVLLQKRSEKKESNPNKWTISVAGHVAANETPLEAAVKEIHEELGIKVNDNQLKFLGTFKRMQVERNTYINHEFNDVYLLKANVDTQKVTLQYDEVSDIKFCPLNELRAKVQMCDQSLAMHPNELKLLLENGL